MTANLETKLGRLTRLVGTDEGLYILALHAFDGGSHFPQYDSIAHVPKQDGAHGITLVDRIQELSHLGLLPHVAPWISGSFSPPRCSSDTMSSILSGLPIIACLLLLLEPEALALQGTAVLVHRGSAGLRLPTRTRGSTSAARAIR